MAAPHNVNAVSPDTLITIKITVNDQLKKLKLPLRDLGITVLPDKLRHVLDIKPEQIVTLERYSDSVGGYIALDESNPQVFKTLIRAAKAKLKLRLKATVTPVELSAEVKEKEGISNTARDSTALDQRSIGSGIFQFREARVSQQTRFNDEAPVPRPFVTNQAKGFTDLAAPSSVKFPPAFAAFQQPMLAFRPRDAAAPAVLRDNLSVYCNQCNKPLANEHFHCSICDNGDYDLCQSCVNQGGLCPGEGHWLIKRFIKDGVVIQSTTERISPRKAKPMSITSMLKSETVEEKEMPGAFTNETKTLTEESPMATRTCNSCVVVLSEREFVTCLNCDDFDLCIKCHTADKHGHHPAHGFKPATQDTILPLAAETKLAPGRNVRHNAICDGCDKKIYGIRHKCLNCPDYDYCNDCVKNARQTHPRHRFAALYEPIADQGPSMVRHFGIYCDGPLCKKAPQSYIQGVRYKCTICHDTDFCASCEGLPGFHHNRTHPLIKLKTPVRNVNVSTENEDLRGNVRLMGDRQASPVSAETKSTATETTPVKQANAATQVQTVAEFMPTEVKKEEPRSIPIPVKTCEAPMRLQAIVPTVAAPSTLLNAHFVRDSTPDGMVVQPESRFTQIWTLKNPGPYPWSAGCSVRYVGGDNMLNVDNSHPASVTAIADATESNVVGREVQIGEEVAFKVVLKAPTREGKSISYWRLKAADGTPFGHRLWCDIEVKKSEEKVEQTITQPPLLTPLQHQMAQAQQAQMQLARDNVSAHPQQAALQRMRIQQMAMARQHAQQQKAREMFAAHAQAQQAQLPSVRVPQPTAGPSEQPPAYDSMNLSARLAVMREQQKQRREQMIAQLNAQREQLQQAQGTMPSRCQHPNSAVGNKAGQNLDDKERREALKQRVAHMKTNIMKTREEREKLAEEFVKQKTDAAEKKNAEESEKVKKIVAEVTKQAEADADADAEKDAEEKLSGSQMVFPKLEKESPSSSTYESATSSAVKGKAAYVENDQGEIERSATPTTTAPVPIAIPSSTAEEDDEDDDDFIDLDEELEVLSANGDDDSSDDGFLTDEEYDILDASDQETVASMK